MTNWNFDREGRIAGWEYLQGNGLVCENCSDTDNAGDPVTMEEAGYDVHCVICNKRIA